MIRNYVISLKNSTTRREHIHQEFSVNQIPFLFYDAMFPGSELDQKMLSICPNLKMSNNLAPREKACFMSHVLLWEKCVVEDFPFVCIFEDDIFLSRSASVFMKDCSWMCKKIGNESFLIKLETFNEKVRLESSALPLLDKFHLSKLKSQHVGAAGYIISKKAAVYLLEKLRTIKEDSILPIDNFIFGACLDDKQVDVYQLIPAICIQENRVGTDKVMRFGSSLEEERLLRQQKQKQLTLRKFRRKLKNFVRKIKQLRYRLVTVPFDDM